MTEATPSQQHASTEAPLVSVAMCTYNGEQYIAQQLQSILEQSYRNLDIVIVDDCSRDATQQILEKFRAQDSRIRLFQNPENLGFIRNFERALRECRGEYIALADQDDVWLPHKIETLLAEIDSSLMIYSRVELIDGNGDRTHGIFPRVKRIEGTCALSLIVDNCVTGHACLMHRDLLTIALPLPDGLFAHDQWLAIAAAASGRLKASTQTLSQYRMHSSNAILGTKTKMPASKRSKNHQKLHRLIGLVNAMIDSGLFAADEVQLLGEFANLLALNVKSVYNHRLARFLRRHDDRFLKLYKDRPDAARKLCRGLRYYKLLDMLEIGFSSLGRRAAEDAATSDPQSF